MSAYKNNFSNLYQPANLFGLMVALSLLYFYVDKPLAIFFHSLDFGMFLPLLKGLTKLGLGILYLPTFFIAALFFRYLWIKKCWEARCWFIWFSLVISSIICVVLKIALGRARPNLWFDDHLYGFYGLRSEAVFWSFPSGHTTILMALALSLALLFPKHKWLCLFIGICLSFTRIVLTHHYLSDLVIATYLVMLEIGLLLGLLRKNAWLPALWQTPNTENDSPLKPIPKAN